MSLSPDAHEGPHARPSDRGRDRSPLPQLSGDLFITDGGLETSVIFQQGIDLVDFAAFTLLESDEGRRALRRYFDPYFQLAEARQVGLVLDTPTWRANLDWGARQGYDRAAMAACNERAVRFVEQVAGDWPDVQTVVDGVLGPRGDGYVVETTMSVSDAARYHSLQTDAFAAAGAAMVTAVTMTYVEEAIGITVAAGEADLPAVISFTVETDGRLPSGQPLGEAVQQVDEVSDAAPAYFMVNCAHPTHFDHVLQSGGSWIRRVRGLRTNASALSHAELDEATELDRGDIGDLAGRCADLCEVLPGLAVIGGCCGTDHEHVAAFTDAVQRRQAATGQR
ncbi:homocysteine S-methyltransferase family protein [Aquihabitans daechungensis]|uniref:homocysteine S-methyltransferase family protein n=1 Tax=Aquihabitans daechungensis TaxID=1052257 RepID=UPI003B9FC1DE